VGAPMRQTPSIWQQDKNKGQQRRLHYDVQSE
jgi:hypothetical protein